MKPVIFKHRGLWYCVPRGSHSRVRVIGLGFTPRDAYYDWAGLKR